jgi:broad specificity phosphatase PhoE
MTRSLDAPTRLVLVRHAETIGNRQQLWTGWSHTPVSELGYQQIRDTAARLAQERTEFVCLYSSPLRRAYQTAEAIGEAIGRRPVSVESLKEMHFGELESIRSERFAADHPEVYRQWQHRTDESFGWPGGETRRAFRQRVADTMIRLSIEHEGQTILIVTHSGVIRMALAHFLPHRYGEWWRVRIGNCSLTHLVLDAQGARVPILDDVTHLESINEGDFSCRGGTIAG